MNLDTAKSTLSFLLAISGAIIGLYNKLRSAKKEDLDATNERLAAVEDYIDQDYSATTAFLDSLDLLVEKLPVDLRLPFRQLIDRFRRERAKRRRTIDRLSHRGDAE